MIVNRFEFVAHIGNSSLICIPGDAVAIGE